MKKIFAAILAVSIALSMTACGEDKPVSTPSTTPSSSSTPSPSKGTSTNNLESAEFTPEQQAAAQKFLDLATRYDGVVDKVNADPNLSEMQEVVSAMNDIVDAMVEADAVFANPADLTADVLAELDGAVAQTNLFLDEIESMLANYGGKKIVTIAVEIVNKTGVEIYGLSMSPADDTSWGGNLLNSTLADGTSGTTKMTFTDDSLVWDLLAMDADDNELTFMGLDFSGISTDGGKLVLSASEDGGYLATFQ